MTAKASKSANATNNTATTSAPLAPATVPAEQPKTAVTKSNPSANSSAQPSATPALANTIITVEEMAAKLLERITATEDDLRDLMQQRAQRVQAHLLQTGKVAAERLFIRAPRPIDAAFKGDTKVEMLLE